MTPDVTPARTHAGTLEDRDGGARGTVLGSSREELLDLLVHVRTTYLRRGDRTGLTALLGSLAADTPADDPAVADLLALLSRHTLWQSGGFEPEQILTPVDDVHPEWHLLARVLTGTYLNTLGRFDESVRMFDGIEPDDPGRAAVEAFLGMELVGTCVSWRFWSRNETSETDGLDRDLRYVADVMANRTPCTGQTRVQVLLAAGLFLDHHGNHSEALHVLRASEESLIGPQSRLYPRVASALALCLHALGEQRAADRYFARAWDGLAEHFGPLGWQLRIARYLMLTDRPLEAMPILEAVHRSARWKREHGYALWARVLLLELAGPLPPATASTLLAECRASGMARAARHVVGRTRWTAP